MWFPIVVLIAQLSAAPAPVQRAYQKLSSQEIEAHKTKKQPPKNATKIDVSAKIRSASFGHQTWLVVAHDGKEFWVEYGASTNTPPGLFGPFKVDEGKSEAPAKDAGPSPTPAPTSK
jgi:hypothetical protein